MVNTIYTVVKRYKSILFLMLFSFVVFYIVESSKRVAFLKVRENDSVLRVESLIGKPTQVKGPSSGADYDRNYGGRECSDPCNSRYIYIDWLSFPSEYIVDFDSNGRVIRKDINRYFSN